MRRRKGELLCDQCTAHALRWFTAENRAQRLEDALRIALGHLVPGTAEHDNARDVLEGRYR